MLINEENFKGNIKINEIMQGKVEVELVLVTKEDAESKPVGKGRDEPEPLEAPKFAQLLSFNIYFCIILLSISGIILL